MIKARDLLPAALVVAIALGAAVFIALASKGLETPSDGPQFCQWLQSQGESLECPDWPTGAP